MIATAAQPIVDERFAHADPINHIVFSKDARWIATADTALLVRIWRDRELAGELDLRSISDKVRPTERIRGMRFAANGESLVVAAGEQVVSYGLSGLNIELEWSYVAPRLFAFLVVSPTSVAAAGSRTVGAFDNGSLVFWDESGNLASRIRHNAVPRYLAAMPDGSVIGTDAFHWTQWRPDQRRPLVHRRSQERIYGMAASSDGQLIALRHLYTTTVHSVADGSKVAEFVQARGLPLVSFAPASHTLAIGTQHAIELYAMEGEKRDELRLDDAELISLGFVPDGSQVAAGCSDGRVRLWDIAGAGLTIED